MKFVRVTARQLVEVLVRREALERAVPRGGACEECGRLVPTKPLRKKPARYCSSLCRTRGQHREHIAEVERRRAS